MREISKKTLNFILKAEKSELTEYYIYSKLSKLTKDSHNSEVLQTIAKEEYKHYEIWKDMTKQDVKPSRSIIFFITLLARILGLTFTLKLMEQKETFADKAYSAIIKEVPETEKIVIDERSHETKILKLLDEERLRYVGSMVLGLSDALVEISGTLAGLTFALQNTRLIALSGLITGIAATLSMASSEFLSAKAEGNSEAKKSAVYTGVAYLITVTLMILPYLLLPNDAYMIALSIMLITVILIILGFTFYVSVAKDLPFRRRFIEMATISLSVAGISFILGILAKTLLGVEI